MSAPSASPQANFFRHLFRVHDEVRLHTPMLAWLLDPRADHGLGAEPLRRWLSQMGFADARVDQAEVSQERSFSNLGRVDLMVYLPDHCLIIENKLHAADQDAQLWRYQQVLNEVGGVHEKHLFYLTLAGDEPSEAAMCSGSGKTLSPESVKCISYQQDIRAWLVSLIDWLGEERQKTRVRDILAQYLEIVMEVTGLHTREQAEKELLEIGLRDHLVAQPQDIHILARLAESVVLLHASLLDELLGGLFAALEGEPGLREVQGPSSWKPIGWGTCEAWARGHAPAVYRCYGIPGSALDHLCLVIGMDAESLLWVGLACLQDGKHLKVPPEGAALSRRLLECEHLPGAQSNEWWLAWVTVPGVKPAIFEGTDGVGRLLEDDLMERVNAD